MSSTDWLNQICRLCGTKDDNLIEIYSPENFYANDVCQDIAQYFRIRTSLDDKICSNCFRFTKKVRDFAEHCNKFDLLHSLLLRTNLVQDGPSDLDELRTQFDIDTFEWISTDESDEYSFTDDHLPNFTLTPNVPAEIPTNEEGIEPFIDHPDVVEVETIIEEEVSEIQIGHEPPDDGQLANEKDEYEEVLEDYSEMNPPPIQMQETQDVHVGAVELIQFQFSNSQKVPFECPECGKILTSRSGIRRHKLAHEGIKKFQCPFCEKSFVRKDAMNSHLITHTVRAQKKFSCNICDKSFPQLGCLKNHEMSHNPAKPYACSKCDTTFRRLGDFNKHRLTHERKPEFICTICPKFFLSMGGLKYHMSVHAGEEPYACEVCNKRFIHSSNLRRHVFRHHGGLGGEGGRKAKIKDDALIWVDEAEEQTIEMDDMLVEEIL